MSKHCWVHSEAILLLALGTCVLQSHLSGCSATPPLLHSHLRATQLSGTVPALRSCSTSGQCGPRGGHPAPVSMVSEPVHITLRSLGQQFSEACVYPTSWGHALHYRYQVSIHRKNTDS